MDTLYPESVKACIQQDSSARVGSEHALALDIVRIAEAIGVWRVKDPRKPTKYAPDNNVDIQKTLDNISECLKIELRFPSPFEQEYGLATKYGIASYRSLNALYQAHLIAGLRNSFGKRVTEIGGGSGRTAYFSYFMGCRDYTIIDVPLSNVAQAIFLGAALGEVKVRLFGEKRNGQPFSIMPPSEMVGSMDVVLNVDSLPELATVHIADYLKRISANAKSFLSINHEAHEARIGGLLKNTAKMYRRNQYWLRDGYLEEIFIFSWPRRSLRDRYFWPTFQGIKWRRAYRKAASWWWG